MTLQPVTAEIADWSLGWDYEGEAPYQLRGQALAGVPWFDIERNGSTCRAKGSFWVQFHLSMTRTGDRLRVTTGEAWGDVVGTVDVGSCSLSRQDVLALLVTTVPPAFRNAMIGREWACAATRE
jgi:hypothetical protein